MIHPLGYESQTANLSTGHSYRYVDIHPPEGTKTIVTALLLHGFPDSAYTWRHQVKGWSNRGIRLIIPDALGYYGSSQPLDPEDYSFKRQSDDYEALIKHIGLPEGEKIVLISHDWGSVTAMRLSQFKPDLVKGVASLCIPFSFAKPSPEYISTAQLVKMLPNFGYQLFFDSPDSAPLIDANLEKFMATLFMSIKQRESGEQPRLEPEGAIEAWLKSDDKTPNPELLTKELPTYKTPLFSAMLKYYQTRKINYELEKDLPEEYRPQMPKLLIIPTQDPALPTHLSANAEKEFQNIEVARLEEPAGHWVQLQLPKQVEEVVGCWVEKVARQGWVM